MKAPAFWWTPKPTRTAALLGPIGAMAGALAATRMDRAGARAAVPVICVGNLVVGGAGKTPTVVALARMLQAAGAHPAVLSRGYGRTVKPARGRFLRVDPARHGVAECGDEPLLLAAVAPTFVAADRRAAARAAVADGADILIMDDGLQNPGLAKDWTLAVADGGAGIGNGLCLPAGPLRAPVARQWPHVAMLCVIGPGAAGERLARDAAIAGVGVVTARLTPDALVVERLRDQPLFAFAGIGRPAKFFATLRGEHLKVTGTRSFPDHHSFRATDLDQLLRDASRMKAGLVTTSKDKARLPPDFPALALPVALVFDDLARMAAALDGVMSLRV